MSISGILQFNLNETKPHRLCFAYNQHNIEREKFCFSNGFGLVGLVWRTATQIFTLQSELWFRVASQRRIGKRKEIIKIS